MKRSEINKAVRTARDVLKKHHFHLPPFADYSPGQWRKTGEEWDRIRLNGLGWDVSDFGGDHFPVFGTVQFTLRNGNYKQIEQGTPYAEKVIILLPGQRLPLHFHYSKTEDIINRGGGIMVMELYNAMPDETVDRESEVHVYCDAVERIVSPGEFLELHPGESITLTPRMFHRFWASEKGGTLICGEVSSVNDDMTDNWFAEPVKRFAAIEEDEPAVYLLCNEYQIMELPGGDM